MSFDGNPIIRKRNFAVASTAVAALRFVRFFFFFRKTRDLLTRDLRNIIFGF